MGKIKVLLVDDEEVFARTLAERLTLRDLSTRAVFSGDQAIESLQAGEAPDIFLLDLKMPGLDGMEVLKWVKKVCPSVETIILTGYDTTQAEEESSSLGAFGYLRKPVDIETLVSKIKAAYRRRAISANAFRYTDFVPRLKALLEREGVFLGENALGVKNFCRDDNQDLIGFLLTNLGDRMGWFDLNSFGAYPAGRGIASFGPPIHHIPDYREDPCMVLFHATHVGCDANYVFGLAERFHKKEASPSCGLLDRILARHEAREKGEEPEPFEDFEMREAEKVISPYLYEIMESENPMAAGAEKLLELGSDFYDRLLRMVDVKIVYVGGINIDSDPEEPGNNFFVPRKVCVFDHGEKRDLEL